MSNVSGHNKFGDYRAIGVGVATMPSASLAIPAKNEARNHRYSVGEISNWTNKILLVDGRFMNGTFALSCRRNTAGLR